VIEGLLLGRAICPILAKNIKKMEEQIDFEPDTQLLDQDFIVGEAQRIYSLEIYDDIYVKLFSDYKIPSEQHAESHILIEQAAIAYTGLSQTQIMRDLLARAEGKIDKIHSAAKKLASLIETHSKEFDLLSRAVNWKSNSDYYMGDTLNAISDKLSEITLMKQTLRETNVAKIAEVGKQSPPSNMAVKHWVHAMYVFWTRNLERNLINDGDGINGRKHILNFMIECMEPLHQAIEANTIDNALRKIQNLNNKGDIRLT